MMAFFRWIDSWPPAIKAGWTLLFLGLALTHVVGLW